MKCSSKSWWARDRARENTWSIRKRKNARGSKYRSWKRQSPRISWICSSRFLVRSYLVLVRYGNSSRYSLIGHSSLQENSTCTLDSCLMKGEQHKKTGRKNGNQRNLFISRKEEWKCYSVKIKNRQAFITVSVLNIVQY